jgi:hypothetical protein
MSRRLLVCGGIPPTRRGPGMTRLILLASLIVGPTAALAQSGTIRTPNPDKLMKCRELARERGFLGGEGRKGGANRMPSFVRDCMQGKQK